MPSIHIKKYEKDYREAAYKAGLSPSRYTGLARSQEEAHEFVQRRPADQPGKPLAFRDGGEADKRMAMKAGFSEETWERRKARIQKARK